MPYEEQQLEALYGPEAKFSDHKRGQIIAYLAYSGQPRRGEIIWVCAAGQALVSGKEMPVHYIVSSGHGWPDIVYPGYHNALHSRNKAGLATRRGEDRMDVKDVKRAITIITREGVRPPSDIAHQEVDSRQTAQEVKIAKL